MTEISASTQARPAHHEWGCNFDALADHVRANFATALAMNPGKQLYLTRPANDLWTAYLAGFSRVANRQHHTCSACRQFISRYGSLATMTEDGALRSVFWADSPAAPAEYRRSLQAMHTAVAGGAVTALYYSSDATWGTPRSYPNGGFGLPGMVTWTHFSVQVPVAQLHTGLAKTAGEMRALSVHHFSTVKHALESVSRETAAQAVTLLSDNTLTNAVAVLPAARWFLALKDAVEPHTIARPRLARAGVASPSTDVIHHSGFNYIWAALNGIAPGWCTPRAGMLGLLWDRIAEGASTAAIQREFGAAMNPTRYQRPQAAPRAGNLAAAEALVQRMGIAPSLARRYLRRDELRNLPAQLGSLWQPRPLPNPPAAPTTGVFAGITPHTGQTPAPVTTGRVVSHAPTMISFARFQRTVLPAALKIEIHLAFRHLPFFALLTATDSAAPPIVQWDEIGARNPVSWYTYPGGTDPAYWGLVLGAWATVEALVLFPHLWGAPHHEPRYGFNPDALFVLAGCADRRQPGSGLFPAVLKNELHEVRATIEAHSNRTALAPDPQQVAGLANVAGGEYPLRVTTAAGANLYRIDRWD